MSSRPPQGLTQGPQPPQWPQRPPQGQSWQPPQQPQQPQWGAPGYQPPPSKPKPPIYRRPWFIIGGAIVLVLVVSALFSDPPAEDTSSSGAHTEERQADQAEGTPATEAAPGIGDAVRDGSFEFVVTAFRCSGEQCRAAMKVENIGSDLGTMFASNQYLFDGRGRRFEADDDLTDALFFEELNPGRTVSGAVIWQVPAGLVADHLELHDSLFSGGVEVKVA